MLKSSMEVRAIVTINLKRLLAWSLSLVAAAGLWNPNAAAEALPLDSASPNAAELFRDAYRQRYTWDDAFPGYTATVSIEADGQEESGIVLVEPDLNVSVFDIADDDLRDFVKGQVQMEIVHRRRLPFDRLHGNSEFQLDGIDDNGAAVVREIGDESNSSYKVKDGTIAQVNRILQGIAVTVDTLETETTPEGTLVHRFKTEFRDPASGKVLECEETRDRHEKIGQYYLLTQRTIEQLPETTLSEYLMPKISLHFDDIETLGTNWTPPTSS